MTSPASFRCLHASDFRLDLPVHGLSEVPESLRGLLIDAPYLAAEQIFDAAIVEDVPVVLLAGNLLRPDRCGPRGPLFLLEQFERLAAAEITVYWACGAADASDAWPRALRLPENVKVFPPGRVSEHLFERDGLPRARIAGASFNAPRDLRPAEFQPDLGGLPSLAVVCGTAEAAALAARGLDYWALGGQPNRSVVSAGVRSSAARHAAGAVSLAAGRATNAKVGDPLAGRSDHHGGLAAFSGSPQGRSPAEAGVHGCTLVEFEPGGAGPRTSFLPCDVVRWVEQSVNLEYAAAPADLERALHAAIESLAAAESRPDLLVSWKIVCEGRLAQQLRRGELVEDVLASLRANYGGERPILWSAELQAAAPAPPAAAYSEETIAGDFLRALRRLEMNPEIPLQLDEFLSEAQAAGELAAAAEIADEETRLAVLSEAAWLGMDLLHRDSQ